MTYDLPEVLKVPLAVAGFRARVAVQRSHQELTFNGMLVARKKYESSQAALKPRIDEIIERLRFDADVRNVIYENGALQSLYEDLGATLILIAAASIERLYQAVGVSLFKRGVASYADGVCFVEAIHSLANQYKHYGEWLHYGPRNQKDVEIVTRLVEQPLRTDAASEFLKRTAFAEYAEFEASLLSCSDGIADPSFLPNGRAGIPTITLRPVEPGHSSESSPS